MPNSGFTVGLVQMVCSDDPAANLAAAVAGLEALRPWAHGPCPRVRKENGRALFLLLACVVTAASLGTAAGAFANTTHNKEARCGLSGGAIAASIALDKRATSSLIPDDARNNHSAKPNSITMLKHIVKTYAKYI